MEILRLDGESSETSSICAQAISIILTKMPKDDEKHIKIKAEMELYGDFHSPDNELQLVFN
jgi:hypothetical protein